MRGFIGGLLILLGFGLCGLGGWPVGLPLILIGLIIWLRRP